jgi:hypothetical protein
MGLGVLMAIVDLPGILAIWNDIDDAVAGDYDHWYQRQHLYERVSIPGFRFGRRYVAHGASPKFFTFYETDSATVLTGGDYLARLNSPTDWTQRLMPDFRNVSRTVCRQILAGGDQSGGYAATVALPEQLPGDALGHLARHLENLDGWPDIARVRVWQAHDTGATAGTNEAALRAGPDTTIGAALVVEGIAADPTQECLSELLAELLTVAALPMTGAIQVYQLICHIDGDEIRRAYG